MASKFSTLQIRGVPASDFTKAAKHPAELGAFNRNLAAS